MAREAVLVCETEKPINFVVADGTGIEKGSLLKLTSAMTASQSTAQNDIVAGIAAREKIASNGQTKLAVYRGGIFRVYASGSWSAGDLVGLVAGNYMGKITAVNLSGAKIAGIALENATDGQQKLIELRPMGVTYNG